MKVLYIGSGLSALQAKSDKYKDHVVVCLNNAWRIYSDKIFDYWIHPADFPTENYPDPVNYRKEIGYEDYIQGSAWADAALGWQHPYPEQYIGYTAFFQGLYWIMMALSPEVIGLLGFDHDYNPGKLSKWQLNGEPNLQNNFNCDSAPENINNWLNEFFKGYTPDSFYGQGTPDPYRSGLGAEYIAEKMQLAKDSAAQLGISIVNYSEKTSLLQIFDRVRL